jgi:hypothetical protein
VFVRPDFLRPSMMKAVGVWVVALFHGGDSSSFLFLEDFLASLGVATVVVVVAAVTGASTKESAVDSGVGVVAVWPFSVTTQRKRSHSASTTLYLHLKDNGRWLIDYLARRTVLSVSACFASQQLWTECIEGIGRSVLMTRGRACSTKSKPTWEMRVAGERSRIDDSTREI